MTFGTEYWVWNRVIGEYCLLGDAPSGVVLLTITPRILAAALLEVDDRFLRPEEAEASFLAAVRSEYAARLSDGEPTCGFGRSDDDGLPMSVAYLAASVLAAYHMHTDESAIGRDYYTRFAEVLGVAKSRQGPLGFNGDEFIALWSQLGEWLAAAHSRTLASPRKVTVRKNISHPLAHVPLRKVDVDHLPEFFAAKGYEPGSRPPLEQLAYDLVSGAGAWRGLTKAGRQALEDEDRRPFVVQQVAYELRQWDGTRQDAAGRKIAPIQVWLLLRNRRAYLYLLGRRPEGFPEVVSHGEYRFVAGSETAYEPLPLGPDDSDLLSEDIRVFADEDNRFGMTRRATSVIALVESQEHAGSVSEKSLRRGANCAVLCRADASEAVAKHLTLVTDQREWRPRQDPTLPKEWRLFDGVVPTRPVEPPAGLESLRVDSTMSLVPAGGLRIRNRWAWLEGHGPQLEVIGSTTDVEIVVTRDVDHVRNLTGRLVPAEVFSEAGKYVIRVGNQVRQRLNVLRPTVNPHIAPGSMPQVEALPWFGVSLPGGLWFVVGSSPGEIRGQRVEMPGGIARTPFVPKWAVRVGAGRGAVARFLEGLTFPVRAPDEPEATTVGTHWAETVYQAAIRKPLLKAHPSLDPAHVERAWARLHADAKSFKANRRRQGR